MGNGASIINAHEGPYSAKRVFTFQPGWGVQMPSQMEEVEGKMYMPLAPGALVGCGHSPTPIDLKFFKQLSFFCKTSKAGKFGLEMKNRADQQILNPWKIYIDIPDTRGSVQKVDCAITVANGVTDSNCTIVVFSDISDNFSIGVDLEFSNTLEENSPELWFAQKAIFKPSWGNNMKKPFKITEDGKEFYPIIPNTYIGSAHGEMGEVDLLDYPGIFLGVQTTQACKFLLEAKNKYDKHIIYMEVRLPNTNNQTEYIYVNLGNNIIDKKDDTRVSLFCLKDSTVKLYVDTEFLFAKASNDVAISSMMGGDNELWAVVGKKLVPASSFKFTAAWGDKLSQDGVEYVNGKEMVKLLGGSVVGCPHAEKSCDLRREG